MECVVAVLVLAIIGGGAWLIIRQNKLAQEEKRKTLQPPPREVTLKTLQTGDVVSFWTGGEKIVKSILQCQDEVSGRTTRWQWVFLDDGQLLEVAPDGLHLFGPFDVVNQGTAVFESLVPPNGVLTAFEERVRAGNVGQNPVHFDYNNRRYRIASTGTFIATVQGPALEDEVWRDVSEKPSENVYFELELAGIVAPGGNGHSEDATAKTVPTPNGEPREMLGVWTTHILLGQGKAIQESDIRALYGA